MTPYLVKWQDGSSALIRAEVGDHLDNGSIFGEPDGPPQ